METLILLIMGTCILGMVIQFLQKEVTGKVFGYAAMFLFIHTCASMLAGFLADEGLLTVPKVNGSITNALGDIDYSHQHQILPTITEKSQK